MLQRQDFKSNFKASSWASSMAAIASSTTWDGQALKALGRYVWRKSTKDMAIGYGSEPDNRFGSLFILPTRIWWYLVFKLYPHTHHVAKFLLPLPDLAAASLEDRLPPWQKKCNILPPQNWLSIFIAADAHRLQLLPDVVHSSLHKSPKLRSSFLSRFHLTMLW